MKTVQVSDGLWKRLKLAGVERGIPLREIMESAGTAWLSNLTEVRRVERAVESSDALDVSRAAVYHDPPRAGDTDVKALAKSLGLKTARELVVELGDE